ncbi:glycoside hydrolase [Streptomyces kaniharaensis]|uniref:Glycoside hydrolase n=1 Tax=Streptomyces kaniharaensis TaxID=212423 RepID=A0A6N7L1B2_9ACTN|nr:C40 family peptidase [Streptomyces kaniharaensis]MQS17530.1 glycoside hydrolase [Streptomyces kaniharaensis]
MLLLSLVVVVPALALVSEVDPGDPGSTAPVASVGGIPARMMTGYVRAAGMMSTMVRGCKGMSWQVVAGIGKVESDHASGHKFDDNGLITPSIIGPRLDGSGAGGNTTAVRDTDGGRWDGDSEFDRAVGPMQFLPSTFAGYAARVRPDNPAAANPNNADDASLATALYLCGDGRDLTDIEQLKKAIYSYNYSSAYVDEVIGWIHQYTALGTSVPTGDASDRVKQVINAAASQIGVPYSWGGGDERGQSYGVCCSKGGQDGSKVLGFDCSGLMLYAFAQVGVHLPRTADQQAGVGQRIPASAGVAALQPGDMVFFGNGSEGIYHVGLYIGGGQMINAPKPGDRVKQAAVWTYDYAGGARVVQ